MKIAFITTYYKRGEKPEIERLKKEINRLSLENFALYVHNGIKENKGYAYGINQGIRKALKDGADLFVFTNPDISLTEVDSDRLLDAAKHFDIWGFALRQNGKTYYGGALDNWRMSGGLIEKVPRTRFYSCDFPSGSLMFVKRDVVERIGFWDESYFLYYDEVDYCARARKHGFRIGVDSALIYDHFEHSKGNPAKEWYLLRSRLKFLTRYGSVKQKIYELARSPKTILEELHTITSYLIREKFILNLLSLNISSLLNKSLHFFLFLFLIRYLKPSEYGMYTLVWAHTGLLSPLLDFGTTSYGLVHLPTERSQKFLTLFSLRFFLSLLVFSFTVLLAYIFRYEGRMILFIILTSFVIFSNMASGGFLIAASQEQKAYLPSFISLAFNALLVIGFVASFLVFRSLSAIFVIVFLFYNAYSVFNLVFISRLIKPFFFVIDIRSWYSIMKKSSVFLLISLFAGLYFKLDIFLLNFLKGKEAVGIYSSGYKFLEASMFFASSYNVASLPLFARLSKGENRTQFVHKIKKDLFLVVSASALFASFLFFLSPIVLPYLMPSLYRESITILRIVIFSLPFIMASSVFLNSLYVLNRAYSIVFLFLFQTILNFSLNYLLIPKYSYYASAGITLVGEIINTTLTFLFLQFFIKRT